MREINEIPENWIQCSIEDVIFYQKGKKPKKLKKEFFSNSLPYLDIKAFEKSKIVQFAEKETSTIINNDDIVIVWDGARSGWVAMGKEGALGSTLARLKPFIIQPKYLFYFLQSMFSYLNTNTKGVGIPHIDPLVLWGINFPLPPIDEQKRIVEKIDELFSELDNGIENLKKARKQLAVYRQTLLKYAFEGKLTEQWRKENNPEPAEKLLERIKEERRKRYEQEFEEWKQAVKEWEKNGKQGKKPKKPKKIINDIKFDKNSNQWAFAKLKYLFNTTSGGTPNRSNSNYFTGNIPWIKSGELKYNIIKDTEEKISEEALNNSNTKLFPKGTLLIALYGATVGKLAILGIEASTNQAVCGIFEEPYYNINFLYYFLMMIRPDLLKQSTGGAQPNISQTILNNLTIPICSLQEQNEIVNIIESQFSIIENLETTIETALNQSELLRQSILKKAFEGKLVPQDPNDEPASVLLERIKKTKEKYLAEQKEQKKKQPKKRKTMDKLLNIEDILKTAKEPMPTKEVWQKSKHKYNIEDFYAELKSIQHKIKEIKKGTESLIELKNEN